MSLALEQPGELADRGRLAGTVNTGQNDDERPRARDHQRLLERRDEVEECRLEMVLRVLVGARALPPCAEVFEQLLRRCDADIRRQQRGFELLERLLVELAAGEHTGQRTGELFARTREARRETLGPRLLVFVRGLS